MHHPNYSFGHESLHTSVCACILCARNNGSSFWQTGCHFYVLGDERNLHFCVQECGASFKNICHIIIQNINKYAQFTALQFCLARSREKDVFVAVVSKICCSLLMLCMSCNKQYRQGHHLRTLDSLKHVLRHGRGRLVLLL